MFESLTKNTLAPLVLRLGLATIFLFHGLPKVGAGGGTNWYPEMPVYQQFLVAWGEVLGGIALLVGFLTRAAAAGLGVIMVGAIATVHGHNGFGLFPGRDPITPDRAGYEYNFVLLVMCVALVLLGGGTLSVERFFRLKRKEGA